VSSPKYAIDMDPDSISAYDSSKISRSRKLRLFTKLLREPITVSGSAYRSGSHPILACKVASEVARSPKVGLVQKLMEEGREAFAAMDYPKAIVKSLAAEELLRKYGGILATEQESDIRDQLQFLKVQYFLLSGQAGEAYKVLREIRHRSHPYLWHRRLAQRSGVPDSHWRAVETTLRQFFKTSHSEKIFALLGYAVMMGSDPSRVTSLTEELEFEPQGTTLLYEPLYRDYLFLVTRITRKEKEHFPKYLAEECDVSPLIRVGETVYVGSARELSDIEIGEIETRIGLETVVVPMSERPLQDRNTKLYAS